MGRSTRLLALLQALRRRHQPVTAATLAREMEVSERTIYRDLSELAAQGASIKGEAGVGYVLRSGFFLPPLMLTQDETEAVLLGLRYVNQRGDDVLNKAAENARAKIGSVLSEDMQAVAIAPMTIPGPDGKPFPENKVSLTLLRSAIRMQKRLLIEYVDQAGQHSRRVVWPIQIGFMDTARVLSAWCELRDDFRFFRTDRILIAELLERYPIRRDDLVRTFQDRMQERMSGDPSVTADGKDRRV
ncbi:YafY family transcriptional regulator [Nitratireductor sp. L1-7-SE]|uniref:YafY family transcriptional regulator n=1 Tax=Nitratireductor rhodophyticola TaxID=2854036 RepID=A0ABS7RAM8_9HYPH|nr:YafY family protein [Nitratireductor rhodophyticola]MBY8917984.1 YafY family transcriptional regulator [Nitratireductor rhodophyticola]MBY8921207.1 YafY family transcriptional regulator [Nitratireductor rhodophyticola]